MRNHYQTKQKELLWEMIEKKQQEFTIKELFQELDGNIGLTTIYRFVEHLEKEGRVTKIVRDNGTVYYQYLGNCSLENHFYLKCEKCKTMIHVDCDYVEDLSKHIKTKHKFQLNKEHIIMNGLCEDCLNKEEVC